MGIFYPPDFWIEKSAATGKPFQFTDYAEYWNTVSRSGDILEASVESSRTEAATVREDLRYNMVNGSSNYYQHRFYNDQSITKFLAYRQRGFLEVNNWSH